MSGFFGHLDSIKSRLQEAGEKVSCLPDGIVFLLLHAVPRFFVAFVPKCP